MVANVISQLLLLGHGYARLWAKFEADVFDVEQAMQIALNAPKV